MNAPKSHTMPLVAMLLVLGIVTSAAGCAEFAPRVWIEYSEAVELTAADLAAVEAKTENGTIKVLAAEDGADTIKVRVRVRAGGISQEDAQACLDAIQVYMPVADRDGGGVQEVFWKWNEYKQPQWQTRVSYEIELPSHLALIAETSNGEIRARGLEAACDAESSNGAILVDGGRGRIHARTSNGRIEVRSAAEDVELRTSNGSIIAELTSDDEVHGEIRTSNGRIELALEDRMSTKLYAKTSNGRVHSDLPLSDAESRRRGREIRGSLGRGGDELEVRTTNGSIGLVLLSQSDIEIDFDLDFDIDVDGDQRASGAQSVGSTDDIDSLPIGIPVEQELETTNSVE